MGRLRDLPIWSKLGLIMIVPTIATIIVGTAGLVDNISAANDADRARRLAALSEDASALVQELQNERAGAVHFLGTPGSNSENPQDKTWRAFSLQKDETDRAIESYQLRRSAIAGVPDELRPVLNDLNSQLSELAKQRDQVKFKTVVMASSAFGYRVIIANLLRIREISSRATSSPHLTSDMQTALAISDLKEFIAQERVVVLRGLITGFNPSLNREFEAALAGQEQARLRFLSSAQPYQIELLQQNLTGDPVWNTQKFEGEVPALSVNRNNVTFTADSWNAAISGKIGLVRKVEVELDEHIIEDATLERNTLTRRVLVQTGLLLGMLLLAIIFAWLVARSMARSLRELRHGALTVAQYGLPQAVARLRDSALASQMSANQLATQLADPLPVRSRDEFGQVTEAFNAVHLEAVRTAAEQAQLRASVATMFVNLARRSQILVDRLIGHLDRLERGEEDPDRLAELFQLDHLATRMRRNDENLLVLAGADSTRVQREPAPLMDVLRAAQSEVEHYTRIEFGMIDRDVEISAHAVNDMVHLIAELLDNATAFSPPDSAVMVEARRVGDRAVILIEDRGIGISPDQLGDLNDRLANPPMVDVAVSRMMGLVVVARLGARHGVKVELRPARERGTIADVTLQAGVLVQRALSARGTPMAGERAVAGSRPGAPLALEKGPAGDMAGAGAGRPSFAAPGSPADGGLFGPPPPIPPTPVFGQSGASAFAPPPPQPPPYNGAPPNGPGSYGPPPAREPGYANTGPGFGGGGAPSRGLPPWSDLTGVNGGGARPSTNGGGRPTDPRTQDPLPQRRGNGWDDEPDNGSMIPRQRPAGPGQDSISPAAAMPPATTAPAPAAGPPAPPAWPPVRPSDGGQPTMPASAPTQPAPSAQPARQAPAPDYAPALDMTAEMPRVRLDWEPDTGRPGSGGSDLDVIGTRSPALPDETMELPIFRELESAWFRTRRGASVGSPGGPGLAPASAPPAGNGSPVAAPVYREAPTSAPPAPEPVAVPVSAPPRQPVEVPAAERPTRSTESVTWRTSADEGWRAAEALAEDQDFAMTETGLPKRVPMSQLVPGGVEKGTTSSHRRSPEAVRGLLSAYHRGVQRGRSQASPQGGDPTSPQSSQNGPHNQGGKEPDA